VSPKLLLTSAVVAGTIFWSLPKNASYQALRVNDGDTFETAEKQRIRLASADAPELGLCGSKESKSALEKFIINKPLYIKVLYRDQYNRLISMVYTQNEFINGKMTEEGYAYYRNRDPGMTNLQKISDEAKSHKRGIFSTKCTQEKNPLQPKCIIKGNNRVSNPKDEKYYVTPGCREYSVVDVQLYPGDQWFCSESETQNSFK